MAPNFRFKKGNPEELEARVVVSSQHVVPFRPKEGIYHLLFGTADRDALIERAESAKVSDSMTEVALDMGEIEDPEFPWYQLPLPPIKSELDLLALPEPIVLDAGRHYHDFTTNFALTATMRRFQAYIESLLRSGQMKTTVQGTDGYETFSGKGKDLLDHMNTKYLNPMIFARLEGEPQKVERLRGKFFRFMGGYQHFSDVQAICDRITAGSASNPDNLKVIDMLAQKISAVVGEEYHKAALITEELKQLGLSKGI